MRYRRGTIAPVSTVPPQVFGCIWTRVTYAHLTQQPLKLEEYKHLVNSEEELLLPVANGTKQEMARCSFQSSLLTETICSILKIVLESMVEDDMTTAPEIEYWVLVERLPFPHTVALVCSHWRHIVSSTPELWTRISWTLPLEVPVAKSPLKKTGNFPVHLIVKQNSLSRRLPLSLTSPYLQQLKSLITDVFDGCGNLSELTGDALQLYFFRLSDIRRYDCFIRLDSCLKLEFLALRTLYVDKNACNLDHQWLKNSMQHIELAISRALQAIPRRIPCLILDDLQFYSALAESQSVTIYAESVILRTCIRNALAAFDGDCQTIVLRECDSIHELGCISLPSSDSLELDGRAAKFIMRRRPKTRPWNGDAVTITNSYCSCISSVHLSLAVAVPCGPASPR